MKKTLTMFLLLTFLYGCSLQSDIYPFEHKNEPIASVELLYYPWVNDADEEFMVFHTIRVLEPDEVEPFMNVLYDLPTKKAGPTPLSNYGAYIARVYYVNGDAEYFGSRHIELVESGTKAYAVGVYYFPGDVFEELYFEYAGDISYLTE